MDDVRRALEKAAEELWITDGIAIDFNSPLMADERHDYRTHAARIVLAFLKEMPVSRDTGCWRKTPWTTATLAAAIEKDQP